MCNAPHHDAGCACGFGPPYLDSIRYGKRTEWAEEVLEDPHLFRRGLGEIDYDDAAINRLAESYAEIRASNLPKSTRVERIKELVGQLEVEREWYDTIKVPLYRFGAPAVKDAAVSYRETEAAWRLKVFGVGTGSSQELRVSRTHRFTVTCGECKEVFVPVRLQLRRVVVRDQGNVVRRGVQAEVDVPKGRNERVLHDRGCKSLPHRFSLEPQTDERRRCFERLLADDRGKAPLLVEQSWGSNIDREVGLFLHTHGIAVEPLVRIRRERVLMLNFSLPPGHDYLAWLWRGGLWWERPA